MPKIPANVLGPTDAARTSAATKSSRSSRSDRTGGGTANPFDEMLSGARRSTKPEPVEPEPPQPAPKPKAAKAKDRASKPEPQAEAPAESTPPVADEATSVEEQPAGPQTEDAAATEASDAQTSDEDAVGETPEGDAEENVDAQFAAAVLDLPVAEEQPAGLPAAVPGDVLDAAEQTADGSAATPTLSPESKQPAQTSVPAVDPDLAATLTASMDPDESGAAVSSAPGAAAEAAETTPGAAPPPIVGEGGATRRAPTASGLGGPRPAGDTAPDTGPAQPASMATSNAAQLVESVEPSHSAATATLATASPAASQHAAADPTALASQAGEGALAQQAKPVGPAAAAPPGALPRVTPEARFADENHPTIVAGVRGQLMPSGGTMHIRLDPPELGPLAVTVRLRNGVMEASFETQSDEAARLLSHSLSALKTSLESQGVNVERLHVQQAPKSESSNNGGNNSGENRDGQQGQERNLDQEHAARQEHQRRQMLRRMWRKLTGAEDPLDMVA